MPFDWHDNLVLARVLHATAAALPGVPAEALQRCVVSRAYYAAYGHAFRYATAYLGFRGKKNADDHGALRAHVKRSRRNNAAQYLEDLRDWRNACDYDANLPPADLPKMMTSAVAAAEAVFRILPPPPAPPSP